MRKIIYIMIALAIFSCKEDRGVSPEAEGGAMSSVLPGDPIFDDLIAQYDTTNITGLITIVYNHTDYIEWGSDSAGPREIVPRFSPETLRGEARFFDGTMDNQFAVDGFTWEGAELNESLNPTWISYSFDDIYSDIKFGDSNHVKLDSNANIVGFDEQVYLSGKPRITNISKGDTLSPASSINVLWSNSSNHYGRISIRSTFAGSSGSAMGFDEFTDDDGSYTISSSKMTSFEPGLYIIEVVQYEPWFIDLSDGKKVCIFLTATTAITVYIS